MQEKFCFCVDTGGRLVEDQHPGIGQKRPCKGDELSLTGGEPASAFVYFRVISVFHFHDEIMRTNCFGSPDDVFVGGGAVAIADIVHDRSGENKAVLHHNAHLRAKGVDRHLGDIHIVDQDRAGVDIVEPADQIYDGGLAGSGGADNGEAFPGVSRKIDILQDRMSRIVAEADVPEFDLSGDRRHCNGVRRIFYQNFLIDRLKDTLQIGDGGQQRVIKAGQRVDRIPEAADIGGKSDQNTDRNAGVTAHHPSDAEHIHKGGSDDGDNVNTRSHQEIEFHGAHPRTPIAAAEVVEDIGVALFAGKGLRDANPVDAFGNVGVQIGLLVALDLPCAALLFLDQDHDQSQHGKTAQADERESDIDHEHEHQNEYQVT